MGTVKKGCRVPRTQGLVLADAKKAGMENVAILSARLGHMFQTEGVSNVKGFAKTAHLVIKLQENVIMDVVCIGQEHFVKNVLMGFTTHSVAACVDLVLMVMCVRKSEDTV